MKTKPRLRDILCPDRCTAALALTLAAAGIAVLAPSAAEAAIVSQVLNERIDPADPNFGIGSNKTSVRKANRGLDLDADGINDVRVHGRTYFEKKGSNHFASSSLQLIARSAGTATELRQDSADNFRVRDYGEALGLGSAIGPSQTYITLSNKRISDSDFNPFFDNTTPLLLYQEFDRDRWSFGGEPGRAALSAYWSEVDANRSEPTLDGPLFIGFRLDAGGGSHRYGFIQFDEVDNDQTPAFRFENELRGFAVESAATVVGFALETTPDTAINTYDVTTVIPEPASLALVALGGVLMIPRPRRQKKRDRSPRHRRPHAPPDHPITLRILNHNGAET